jgi:D-lactate dehydrogenase (cytochrome)
LTFSSAAGIVTEATLKLAVIPEHHSVVVVPFKSVRAAVSAASQVIRKGVPVASLELMDAALMKMVNESKATYPRTWQESPTLFLRFSGTRASVQDNVASVQDIVRGHDAGEFEFAKDEEEEKLLWSARKESLWSILAFREENEELRE